MAYALEVLRCHDVGALFHGLQILQVQRLSLLTLALGCRVRRYELAGVEGYARLHRKNLLLRVLKELLLRLVAALFSYLQQHCKFGLEVHLT